MTRMKRILFGLQPEWQKGLQFSADPTRFDVVMADLAQTDTSGFDAVVPLSLADHVWLETSGQGLPALPVARRLRRLCNDKLQLNQHLIDLGFRDHVPPMRDSLPKDPSLHPVIIKLRRGAWGKGSTLLLTAPIAAEVTEKLAAGTHFIQDFTPGRYEYATHVLMHRGVPRLLQTNEYDMGEVPGVKGITHRPLKSRWLAETPGQDVLLRMLAAIGFDQGTCCIDYRMVEGRPVLFEINPRFGGSLSWKVTPYLDRYLACLDGEAKRAQMMSRTL